MRKLAAAFVSLMIAVVTTIMPALSATDPNKLEAVKSLYGGFQYCLVMSDLKTAETFRLNEAGCAERLSPCSTFKIFNSLAGLESGFLRNEMHAMKWDGTKYEREEVNRDQTLQSAVTNSVVWYFQRVAAGVGEPKMKEYLHAVGYGNEDISGGLTKFWLGSSLKISADEQVVFLKKLVKDKLPFSKRNMAVVRGLIRLNETPKGILYGKTGSDMQNGKRILGWFAGYVVSPQHVWVFATNIRAADGAWGPKAREIVEAALQKLDLL